VVNDTSKPRHKGLCVLSGAVYWFGNYIGLSAPLMFQPHIMCPKGDIKKERGRILRSCTGRASGLAPSSCNLQSAAPVADRPRGGAEADMILCSFSFLFIPPVGERPDFGPGALHLWVYILTRSWYIYRARKFRGCFFRALPSGIRHLGGGCLSASMRVPLSAWPGTVRHIVAINSTYAEV